MSISDYSVGQLEVLTVAIAPADILAFAELSGDFAPIHMDAKFARSAGFDGVLVHGAHLSALLSQFVGMKLPGRHAVLERMDVNFRKPCYAPVDLTITGRVVQVSEAVATIALQLTIERAPGDAVATAKSWHRILNSQGDAS